MSDKNYKIKNYAKIQRQINAQNKMISRKKNAQITILSYLKILSRDAQITQIHWFFILLYLFSQFFIIPDKYLHCYHTYTLKKIQFNLFIL